MNSHLIHSGLEGAATWTTGVRRMWSRMREWAARTSSLVITAAPALFGSPPRWARMQVEFEPPGRAYVTMA
jgi:hypothetical protein